MHKGMMEANQEQGSAATHLDALRNSPRWATGVCARGHGVGVREKTTTTCRLRLQAWWLRMSAAWVKREKESSNGVPLP